MIQAQCRFFKYKLASAPGTRAFLCQLITVLYCVATYALTILHFRIHVLSYCICITFCGNSEVEERIPRV